MLDGVTYRHAEREEENLRNGEEGSAEDDITDRPSVLERAEDENELRHNIYGSANERPENVDDPQADRLRVVETGKLLEGGDRDEERDGEYNQAGNTK